MTALAPSHSGLRVRRREEPSGASAVTSPAREAITTGPPMLFGTLAVALLLAGTRWSSYLGYNPLFFTDAFLGLGVLVWIWDARRRDRAGVRGLGLFPALATVGLYFSYIVVRALLSPGVGSMTWLRDFIPFGYVFVAFLACHTYVHSTALARARSVRLILWAVNFHSAWVFLTNYGLLNPDSFPIVPGSPVHFFYARPDADQVVTAVAAAIYIRRLMTQRLRAADFFWLVVALAGGFGFVTRAGLIAVILVVALTVVASLVSIQSRREKYTWVALLLVVGAILMASIGQTTAGQRLLASAGLAHATSDAQRNAVGTTEARKLAWHRVIHWTGQVPRRELVGCGFGPDFLHLSTADVPIEGTDYKGVRSPHNWIIGEYARLGLLGVLLSVTVIGQALLSAVVHCRRIMSDEAAVLGTALVFATLPVALMGVELEAPFGAVPFWWGIGIVAGVVINQTCKNPARYS